MQFLRVGTSGMRGKLAEGLSPDVATKYLSALGTYAECGKMVIGRDSRVSSRMFYELAISVLTSCGIDVIAIDLAIAAELSFAIKDFGACGGLLISAGHHAADWNSLIPFNQDGSYFNSVQTQELLDIYHSGDFRNCTWDKIGDVIEVTNEYKKNYADELVSKIDIEAIAKADFSVILDFCNGPGSIVAEYIIEKYKLNFLLINKCKSGHLPHDPEPRPRNASQVQTLVTTLNSDAGFVFCSDMSRFAIVTEKGDRLSEECSYPIVLYYLLKTHDYKGSVVSTYCTTKMVDDIVLKYGAKLVKAEPGQSYVVDKISESGALIGGEGSGSVSAPTHLPCYDGFLGILLVLENMAKSGKSLSELKAKLPEYHIVKKKISCNPGQGYSIIRNARNFFSDADVSEVGGIRFDWKDGWVNLRPSRTEPILRMTVEHKSKEKAVDLALQVRGLLERLVSL